jgi:hypothetical protein
MLQARSSGFYLVCRVALRLCALVFLLAGCSLVRPLNPDEQEAIRQNKKAIVLYRLTGALDGKEVHLLLENFVADYFNKISLTFGLANLDTAERIKSFSPVERSDLHLSPSPEAARSGWGAFMLEPGTYYLRITSEGADRQEMFEPVPEFRFVVPPNTPLLYIGSLHLACTTKETASWFGGRDFRACSSRATAANEAEAARVVAEASFRDFGSPLAMMMQPYRTPLPLPPGTISKLAPVGLLVPGSKTDLGSPEWMKRALALGLVPSRALAIIGAPFLAVGPVAGILWAPIGAGLGYLGGKWSESSWEPCRKVLQESISKFDPMAALATKLKGALDRTEVQTLEIGTESGAGSDALASDVKSILTAQILRIALRHCGVWSSTLCLDVLTRAQLFEAATKRYRYDNVLVYSVAESAKLELQPYQVLVRVPEPAVTESTDTQSPGRELEAYCGKGGGEILQEDLSKALDATVNRVAQDLGLKLANERRENESE